MEQLPPSPSFVWVCPKCGRKVPNRLNECRCTYQRGAEDIAFAPDAPLAPLAPPAPTSGFHWMVLIGVAGAAVGLLVALQLMPKQPARQTAPSINSDTTASAPAPAASASAEQPATDTHRPGALAFPDSWAPAPAAP